MLNAKLVNNKKVYTGTFPNAGIFWGAWKGKPQKSKSSWQQQINRLLSQENPTVTRELSEQTRECTSRTQGNESHRVAGGISVRWSGQEKTGATLRVNSKLSHRDIAPKNSTFDEFTWEFLSGLYTSMAVQSRAGSAQIVTGNPGELKLFTGGEEGLVPIHHWRRANDQEVSQLQARRCRKGAAEAHAWASGRSGKEWASEQPSYTAADEALEQVRKPRCTGTGHNCNESMHTRHTRDKR